MEKMKKGTEGAVAGIYSAFLPTNSPMEIKNNIILIYSIGEILKICWLFFNFAPTFCITLHIFRGLSVIPSAK